jgi:hypothetical protein
MTMKAKVQFLDDTKHDGVRYSAGDEAVVELNENYPTIKVLEEFKEPASLQDLTKKEMLSRAKEILKIDYPDRMKKDDLAAEIESALADKEVTLEDFLK